MLCTLLQSFYKRYKTNRIIKVELFVAALDKITGQISPITLSTLSLQSHSITSTQALIFQDVQGHLCKQKTKESQEQLNTAAAVRTYVQRKDFLYLNFFFLCPTFPSPHFQLLILLPACVSMFVCECVCVIIDPWHGWVQQPPGSHVPWCSVRRWGHVSQSFPVAIQS